MVHTLERLLVRHTLRLPAQPAAGGAGTQGAAAARQFDVALMSVGFKLSAELFAALSSYDAKTVTALAARTLTTVRELVGDHVRHNTYFVDFPANVPDTAAFWAECVDRALGNEVTRPGVLAQLRDGVVDLLSLPGYGRYQHRYEEMLAAHEELTASPGDRVTLLHLGGTLHDEAAALYLALAGSRTPLGEEHLADLAVLAQHHADGPQPEAIPVREHRAVVNRARLRAGVPLLADTVTDVLRLACALSGGDVGLLEPTRFRAPSRPHRRALLAALDAVVAGNPAKLADVPRHREAWKRLGERLHPHEYPQWPHAAEVFAVARGEREAPSLAGHVEDLLARNDVTGAAELLATAAPGVLFRSLDRLLRTAADDGRRDAVLAAAERAAPRVSGRVVLSVRDHIANRADGSGGSRSGPRRVFVNRRGAAWVTEDTRPTLPAEARERLVALLDAETLRRLDVPERLLVDPAVLDVALPLSGRAAAAGIGTLPRGSVSPVDGDLLRFFTYWKQSAHRTDHDLSALVLDADYDAVTWLSYTALSSVEGVHSGDITNAPDGASEFIELRLGAVRGDFVVPQVHVYSGEHFEAVEESFFGFMTRDADQGGAPFEPRTVRMKSDLRGPGRIALPLAFQRDEEGRWKARWLHLYLRGEPQENRVEENVLTFAVLLRGLVERTPLTVRHLTELMTGAGARTEPWDGRTVPDEPVTFIGLERPDGLPAGSRVITPENLRDLIPA
ncbi:hypothetical protein RGF97_05545 [Streptomyces roseicoloratus]|uniref:TerD domain-containing protein n=1 Tax=Streptomyces roseicoloratus TaxID=2508722 RepID=A0ABY9RRU4_9ACTN|nr:hypothetical protein [Streptomyces roseicoloratus]WMX44428.1 hypothetical protein RGF97_05545 [Streptomyces roseicoloratus]